jgi:hypothetical protein
MADGPRIMPNWQPCQLSDSFLKPLLDSVTIGRYNGWNVLVYLGLGIVIL